MSLREFTVVLPALPPCLKDLSSRLMDLGYSGGSIEPILKCGVLNIDEDMHPALVRRCREDGSPAARLICFWLLLEPIEAGLLRSLLGSQTCEALAQLELIEDLGGSMVAQASLFPCLGHHFFADPVLSRRAPLGQPWLNQAGYSLALASPGSRIGQSLDLSGGAGIQAIINAGQGLRSWAVGQHPYYSHLNALVNAVDVRFVGQLAEVEGEFQLITARVTNSDPPLASDLPWRLRVGGTMVLAVRHLTPDRPLLDGVESWLGGPSGWGLAQVDYSRSNLNEGKGSSVAVAEEWGLSQLGYQAAQESLVYVRRLPPGRPSWRLEAAISTPQDRIADVMESWLDAQEVYDSWRAEWRPRWSFTQRLLIDPQSGFSLVRYQKGFAPAALDPLDTFLLDQVDGHKSAEQLLQAFASRFERDLEESRSDVTARLLKLCRRVMIR